MEFLGYPREDGSAGTRNHVGVIANVVCASDLGIRIARVVDGCVPFTHRENCTLIPPDSEVVTRTLINLGRNPNLAAVLVVSPYCSGCIDPIAIADGIAQSGKPVDVCQLYKQGGMRDTVAKGVSIVHRMVANASKIRREPVPISKLRLGVECGGSTPISGPVTNAAQGAALDLMIKNGGSGGFTETTEVVGAEHVIAKRAINHEVKQKMINVVRDYEERLKSFGMDLFGANPDPHNVDDGLSSVEDKALGAIAKSGTTPLTEVLEFGEASKGEGLFFIDAPGGDLPSQAALAAAGCNVITFSTECINPTAFPFVPVLKITARRDHFERFPDSLDYLVDIDRTVRNVKEIGQEIFELIVDVASGRKTQNEVMGWTGAWDLWTITPTT